MSLENRKKYPEIEKMSTEELRYMLRTDSIDNDDVGLSDDLIFYITEVLCERETENTPNVKEAWERFNKIYRPYKGESLYDFSDNGEVYSIEKKAIQLKKPRKSIQFFKGLGFVAAVMAVLFMGTIGAYAFGFDLFGAMADWTRDVFGFENQSEVTWANGDEDIYEELENHWIGKQIVPKWLPDGYVLDNYISGDMETRHTSVLEFKNIKSNQYIFLDFTAIDDEAMEYSSFEKDENLVSALEKNDITHYIFNNLGLTVISWSDVNFECSIMGDFSVEDAEKIINSIYD